MRKQTYETFKSKGYSFAAVIHPSAIISSEVIAGKECKSWLVLLFKRVVKLAINTIINTRSSVDHDCIISSHVHVAQVLHYQVESE